MQTVKGDSAETSVPAGRTIVEPAALLGCPWVYLLVEVVVMNLMYVYMHRTHEKLCERLTAKIRPKT